MKTRTQHVLLGLASLAALTGCNIFGFMDSPGTNEQYLSRARACFNDGDKDCALEYYGKLTGDFVDIATAESAFVILEDNGAGIKDFITALGDNADGAKGLNNMASAMSSRKGSDLRRALQEAYKKADSISDNNKELRGLVRFVSAFAIMAAVFAEEAATHGNVDIVEMEDFVLDGPGCRASSGTPNPPSCDPQIGAVLHFNNTVCSLPSASCNLTEGDLGDTATLDMAVEALKKIDSALKNEIGASGKYSNGVGGFATRVLEQGGATDSLMRQALIVNGIGN